MGILGGGAQAELAVAHEGVAMKIPAGLSFEEAAALPEAFLVAYDGLVLQGRLEPGDSVLVTAAGSGVGLAAAQVVQVAGGRLLAASRSGWKRERLRGLGALEVVDPTAPDALARVREAAGGEGIALAFDLAGASSFDLVLQALAPKGRLVLVGTLGGGRLELDLSLVLRKRLTLVGTVLRGRALDEKIALVRSFSRGMLPLVASGRLRPVLDRVLPLERVAEAHALLERNETFGKIVLRLD
jgi:NADPH:quinone reductase-like Zn-dependent oxidoreductase